MADSLSGKYFIKRNANDEWVDVTTMFDGIRILSIDGFNEQGEALNVYDEQWINSQVEDVMVTTQVNGNDVIIRKNVDLSMTFLAAARYAENPIIADTQTIYDNFVSYIARSGAFYIRSNYTNKTAHVICLKSFKPTTQRLQRGSRSHIIATIPLHCLDVTYPYNT